MTDDHDDHDDHEQTAPPAVPGQHVPDAFASAMILLQAAVDPKASAAKLAELRGLLDSTAEAQTKLAADRAAFDEHMAKANAELDGDRQARSRRLQAVQAAEGNLADREACCLEREKSLGLHIHHDPEFVPIKGTTITRSFDPRQRAGFDGNAFPDQTTITRSVLSPEAKEIQDKLPMRPSSPPRSAAARRSLRHAARVS